MIGRFHLLPAYDKYVRPHVVTEDSPATPGAIDKGKGKEKELATATPNDDQDGDDDEGGKGDKKKKNSYKHLIKGVPGAYTACAPAGPALWLTQCCFASREAFNEKGRLLDDDDAGSAEAAHVDNTFRSKDTTRSVLGQLGGFERSE